MMSRPCLRERLLALLFALGIAHFVSGGNGPAFSSPPVRLQDSGRVWEALLSQADALNLPTRFLRQLPIDFVRFEFEDLRSFAAEYHPGEHRMVLNRTLSFNAAGGALKPLNRMTHRELQTLYHELFHAYMDYWGVVDQGGTGKAAPTPVIDFAREQQQCRYQAVLITPVVQRKTATETRFLTERESWEALNETWAVFVGWAVWTHLEVQKKAGRNRNVDVTDEWAKRLKKADHDGDLRGYYEPEDPAERAVTHKRFLAPQFRISPDEVAFLMDEILDQQRETIQKLVAVMEDNRRTQPLGGECGSRKPK